jgi:hypothetical protein
VSRAGGLVGLTGICATLVACGGAPPPAAPPKPVAAAAPETSAGGPAAPLVTPPAVPRSGGPEYESKDRRDPFLPLDIVGGGPKGLEVATTKLTGIVRSARTTLALVEAQDGIGYILKPGDTLGDGRLVEIGADTVVFAVSARPGTQSNRVVLRLAAN